MSNPPIRNVSNHCYIQNENEHRWHQNTSYALRHRRKSWGFYETIKEQVGGNADTAEPVQKIVLWRFARGAPGSSPTSFTCVLAPGAVLCAAAHPFHPQLPVRLRSTSDGWTAGGAMRTPLWSSAGILPTPAKCLSEGGQCWRCGAGS